MEFTLAELEDENKRLRARLVTTASTDMGCTNWDSASNSCTTIQPSSSNYTKPFRNAEIVTLLIGGPRSPAGESAPATFYVHKRLLEQCSPVLRAMLSQSASGSVFDPNGDSTPIWLEGHTRTIHMPEDRIEDVEFLLQWLYCGLHHRNALYFDVTDHYVYQKLYIHFIYHQSGLEHSEIDLAVSKYAAWKYSTNLERKAKVSRRKMPLNITPHNLIPKPQQQARNTSQPLSASASTSLPPAPLVPKPRVSQSRPQPPPFGPLIRLYILADKYNIDTPSSTDSFLHPKHGHGNTSLRNQIIQRIKAIHILANCVPDIEDVERLWTCVPVDTEGLKSVIVEMYAGLSRGAFGKVFGVGSGRHVEGEKECEWHPEFLWDLLVRKVLGYGEKGRRAVEWRERLKC